MLQWRDVDAIGVGISVDAGVLERPAMILPGDQLEDRLYGWGKEVDRNAVD